ncbi:MAG: nicotinamide-nucleotide amidohydrolase family protein [Firmicutes bacterium]|nr:nicotinamide-nucleotide amidohydrolase family protein [Bacillota bacterium]
MNAAFLVIDYESAAGAGGILQKELAEAVVSDGISVTATVCVWDCDFIRQIDFLLENNDAVFVVGAGYELRAALDLRDTEVMAVRAGKPVVLLPSGAGAGVILQTLVLPQLRQKKRANVVTRVFHAFGLSAADCREKLAELLKVKRKAQITFAQKPLECDVIVKYPAGTPPLEIEFTVSEITKRLAGSIYGEGPDTLQKRLVDTLTAKKLTFSAAESFTGGGVASKIISTPGASKCFVEGVTAYSDKAKISRLGVPEKIVSDFTSVSLEVAYEMAAGLLSDLEPDIVVATTGYAGPGGENAGQCFIAVGDAASIRLFPYNFKGDRYAVTECGIKAALFHALSFAASK